VPYGSTSMNISVKNVRRRNELRRAPQPRVKPPVQSRIRA
jgi:hypothetical protein